MEKSRYDLYVRIRRHPKIAGMTVKQKNLFIMSKYGTNQIAMLTLSQMNDLYQTLTSTNEPTDEQEPDFIPVSEALKSSK